MRGAYPPRMHHQAKGERKTRIRLECSHGKKGAPKPCSWVPELQKHYGWVSKLQENHGWFPELEKVARRSAEHGG